MNMLDYEYKYWSSGTDFIAGIDEAGRGPLAGPVVASAVILPHDINLPEVTDSKKLSEKKLDRLFDEIMDNALAVGIGIVQEREIDKINILQATYRAMEIAVAKLRIKPEVLLVDGLPADIKYFKQDSIIKGDSKSLSIASASIIAKVTRDRMMLNYDRVFPEYGFSRHKGYGSRQHIDSIKTHFASPVHRQSFKPVFDYLPSLRYYIDNHLVTKLGKQLVACKLIRDGHEILQMNYNFSKLREIDIISRDGNGLIFINTKTQIRGQLQNEPTTKIDTYNSQELINTARSYTNEYGLDTDFRFDLAEVILGSLSPKINIIKNGLSVY